MKLSARQLIFMLAACLFILGGAGFIIDEGITQTPDYAGIAKCKLCHPRQYKIWNDSRHARAFEDLKAGEQEDPKCLSCHLTGYREVKQVKPEMASVQCEACHGAGSLYISIHSKKDKEGARKAGLTARPDQERCRSCHNQKSPTFKGFDYAKMWEKIKH